MDVGSSEAWTEAPHCTWSPIPPPELRGELLEDLSTNGGFVTFGIYLSYHTQTMSSIFRPLLAVQENKINTDNQKAQILETNPQPK